MAILKEVLETSSSTSTTNVYKYDVFLSFRGTDTRYNFTDHLYNALVSANLTTFLDDEKIPTGEELKPELESAIKASRAFIIVLSKNYASSRWCLDELVLILQQNKTVIPVFYHVDPTDVRKQQITFGDAMAMHKQRMEEETDAEKRSQLGQKMELWKKALTQVADLKGRDVEGRKETEFIKEIVNDVYHRLGVPLRTSQPQLIGADYNIGLITSWLKDGSSYTADIFTILGIGGIGKTTLARYIYGIHSRDEFDRSSFIRDISRKRLLDVQKELFDDISQRSSIPVHDVYSYTSMIENTLACKKVFVVLDDVDSLDQLDALLGSRGLHPGSKIIVTTKDGSLTKRCALFNPQVQPKHTQIILEGLYETEALELLCIHAFECRHKPKKGYEKVADELNRYCGGHPLALEVLGRSLRYRDVAYWEGCIKRLKKGPESHIRSALQMSFDSLPSKDDKELFKHIACFFVGADKDVTEIILEACDIDTRSGIIILMDRCLLSNSWSNKLTMHQLVQEMGRDLVHQESPHKPWERSRLCCHEESFMVLKQKKGKENLLGLALDMRVLDKQKLRGSFELKPNSLYEMNRLMLLQLNYVQIDGFFEKIPEELRWLCMHGFPLKSFVIPSDSSLENLVVLDMSYSKIESFGIPYCNPQPPAKRQKFLEPQPPTKRQKDTQETSECGVMVVYDDEKMEEEEEDVLGYYRTWNHIIGGDLSPFEFQGTTGEYLLENRLFMGGLDNVFGSSYKFKAFKTFSQRKPHILNPAASQNGIIKGSSLQIEEAQEEVINEAEAEKPKDLHQSFLDPHERDELFRARVDYVDMSKDMYNSAHKLKQNESFLSEDSAFEMFPHCRQRQKRRRMI